jgi:epoxyqueuosine reductase
VIERVLREVKVAGWRAAIMPFSSRAEATRGIALRHARGELDEAFYAERVAYLAGEFDSEIPNPRSLFAVAVPDRPVRVRFTFEEKTLEAIVPPTYIHGERSDRAVEERIRKVLAPAGFTVARAQGPKKAMLTLSELGQYGRNNLAYVAGLGSYHRPVVLVSDVPYEEVPRREEPMALPRCSTCTACLAACPTHAIGEDRFLVHAERCLTFWNEKPPDVSFPSWVRPEWHNALVGCLRCQEVCPENRPFIGSIVEGPCFDEEATRAFLAGASKKDLPVEVQEMLEDWDLADFLDVLPRNLGALATKATSVWARNTNNKREVRK